MVECEEGELQKEAAQWAKKELLAQEKMTGALWRRMYSSTSYVLQGRAGSWRLCGEGALTARTLPPTVRDTFLCLVQSRGRMAQVNCGLQ